MKFSVYPLGGTIYSGRVEGALEALDMVCQIKLSYHTHVHVQLNSWAVHDYLMTAEHVVYLFFQGYGCLRSSLLLWLGLSILSNLGLASLSFGSGLSGMLGSLLVRILSRFGGLFVTTTGCADETVAP